MARKEISIFGASFLDLMAGALGAVLILYVIVPKLNISPEEFKKQQQLSEEINKMGVTLDELSGLIPKDQLEELQQQIQKIKQAKAETEKEFEKIQNELKECKSKLAQITEDYRKYKTWMDQCGFKPGDPCPEQAGADVDVGFKFKGRKLVFVIDNSGSMYPKNYNGWKNRSEQVRSGIKMLMSTMGPEYSIEIVAFPYRTNWDFNPLWKTLRILNEENRESAIRYLNRLSDKDRKTPTGTVLEYVFNTYSNVTDILLLTDGRPTDSSEEEILSKVRQMNQDNVQIHSIGVGEDFINNPSNPNVRFLKKLASQNNGFFIGF